MVNLLAPIDDFDELRSTARKIDEGLMYLEKKLENVSNLGLSLDPQKTKKIGEDTLQEYIDEIEEMKRNVNMCLKSDQDALQDYINDSQQVSSFIEQIISELNEMETQLLAKGNYQPYERTAIPENTQELDNLVTDMKELTCSSEESSFLEPQSILQKVVTPDSRKLHSTMSSININNVTHNLNTSIDQFLSPFSIQKETSRIGKYTGRKEYGTSYEFDNRSLSELCESNSIAMLEKKLNRTDDVIKTPVDPGVSVLTMQVLGKSNLKTKIYKENISNISYTNKSPS